MSIYRNHLPIMGASGQSTGYTIDQSIRFNDNDSAFMSRTPSSTSSNSGRRKWTISCWVKIGAAPGDFTIWSVHTGNQSYAQVRSDGLEFAVGNGASSNSYHKTNRVFRDSSAWYHFVFVFDSTSEVNEERARIYVNGQREISFSNIGSWAENYDSNVNHNQAHYIGEQGTGGNHWDGYITEFHQLDGYAYGPEYFGEFNDSNIWIPKEYTDSYGGNGHFFDGRDSSDLGDDESGNGNDFTTSGLAANDQVLDTPTNNFAVLNPVDTFSKLAGEIRNGNLELKDNSASAYVYGRATFEFDVTDSDGWYWESLDVVDGSGIGGITEIESQYSSGSALAFTGARGFNSINTGSHMKLENTTYNSVNLGVTSNAGDIIQFCAKNGKLFIGINGTYVLSGNPATEANPLFSSLTGKFAPFAGLYSGSSYNTIHNFGQDGTFAGNKTAQGNKDANGFGNFYYAPPTGAKALCSRSLGA